MQGGAHPALVLPGRPLLGPHALARSERVYALLHRAGLDGPRLTTAVGALTYFVQGYTAAENVWRTRQRDPAAEGALRRRTQEYLDRRAELYPTLAQHAAPSGSGGDFDASFRLGLETVLDGIAAHTPTT
ncbi:TetR/AcrR family transcriptional regulator C-terminal domain-containing protein [Streptomyces sp. NPDC048057]|uniref:TetR/AcrR family transcriptional regulator C-terminal domain-containing protein n=1 Tax=Streptomyces sp. NPDC048057 TaxID=3155628 RepID=UPI0033C45117